MESGFSVKPGTTCSKYSWIAIPTGVPPTPQITPGRGRVVFTEKKNPRRIAPAGVCLRSLAVTYSCMAKDHTTIGAERFHFRVRKGIGWFPLAMTARQTGSRAALFARAVNSNRV